MFLCKHCAAFTKGRDYIYSFAGIQIPSPPRQNAICLVFIGRLPLCPMIYECRRTSLPGSVRSFVYIHRCRPVAVKLRYVCACKKKKKIIYKSHSGGFLYPPQWGEWRNCPHGDIVLWQQHPLIENHFSTCQMIDFCPAGSATHQLKYALYEFQVMCWNSKAMTNIWHIMH